MSTVLIKGLLQIIGKWDDICFSSISNTIESVGKIKGKLYFGFLNFHVILQTPLNFKISHFGSLNFELLSIRIIMLILAIKNSKKDQNIHDFYFFLK